MRSRRDEPVEVTEDPAASPRRAGEESEARMTQSYPPQLEEPTDPEAPATALSLPPPSASVTRAPVTCRLCGALEDTIAARFLRPEVQRRDREPRTVTVVAKLPHLDNCSVQISGCWGGKQLLSVNCLELMLAFKP